MTVEDSSSIFNLSDGNLVVVTWRLRHSQKKNERKKIRLYYYIENWIWLIDIF
jgi:hypothetical protein